MQVPEGFQVLTQPVGEALPAAPFVFAAYAVVWLVIFGYVGLVWRRLARVDREIADLKARKAPTGR
jgi:CcmD family protein